MTNDSELSDVPIDPVKNLVTAALAGDPARWEPWLYTCLAESSRNAIVGTKARQRELSRTLQAAWRNAFSQAEPETRAAVASVGGSSQLQAAYRLGQIGFAHMLVSQTLNRRVDDDLAEVILDDVNGPVVRAIVEIDEPTVTKLSTRLGKPENDVRATLRALIVKGAVDFRGPPPVKYFLTPVAKSTVSSV